jgi:hypothetical protein
MIKVKKPELVGVCLACKEWTDAYEPCCNKGVLVGGSVKYFEDLQEDWEQKTGVAWDSID